MDPIFQTYEDRLIRRRRDPQTLRLFRYGVSQFEEGMRGLGATPRSAEPWQVEEWFSSLELAWGTRRNILQHVRSAYSYAQKRGVLQVDPTYDVDLGRPPERDPVVIPNLELRRIQAACATDDDLLLFHLLAYTGMRRFEIAKLEWGDVNLVRERLRVLGKGEKLRHVPIHPLLHELLLERRYHLGQRVIRWVHYDHLKKIGTERTFHDFRRTLATSLRRNGAQPQVIDRIFGWAPRNIMGRYYDSVADEETAAAILLAYRDDPL